MHKNTAMGLSRVLVNATVGLFPAPGLTLLQGPGSKIHEVHPWVNDRTCQGLFLLESFDSEPVKLIILNQYDKPGYKDKPGYHFVVYPIDGGPSVAEFRNVVELDNKLALLWRYKPTKQDGRNEERKAIFASGVGNVVVSVPLPETTSDVPSFLDSVRRLIRARLFADQLVGGGGGGPGGEYSEGGTRQRLHTYIERNPAVVKRAKSEFQGKHGRLFCEICGFDFAQTYGSMASGYIEAHHKTPLSKLKGEHKTKPSDLLMVCANCHRMLHKGDPWPTINGVRSAVEASRS